NVYVVFRHYDCTDQFFLVIDDIIVEGDMTSASLTSLSDNQNISIYPQPMNENLTIELADEIESIVVVDQNGRDVLQETNINLNTITLNTNSLKSGVYFIKITSTSGHILTQKCVK